MLVILIVYSYYNAGDLISQVYHYMWIWPFWIFPRGLINPRTYTHLSYHHLIHVLTCIFRVYGAGIVRMRSLLCVVWLRSRRRLRPPPVRIVPARPSAPGRIGAETGRNIRVNINNTSSLWSRANRCWNRPQYTRKYKHNLLYTSKQHLSAPRWIGAETGRNIRVNINYTCQNIIYYIHQNITSLFQGE